MSKACSDRLPTENVPQGYQVMGDRGQSHAPSPTATSGYHLAEITKGEYGQLSKVQEELLEAMDALAQGSTIMLHTELSDLYGALEAAAKTHGTSMEQLKLMSDITKRAFHSGDRS